MPHGLSLSRRRLAPLRRFKWIAPGYFKTMVRRILAGRDLTWAEIYNDVKQNLLRIDARCHGAGPGKISLAR